MKRMLTAVLLIPFLVTSAELTWNGGRGGVWDEAAIAWLDGNGQPTAWTGGSTAVIPSDAVVRVRGEVSAAGIRFSGNGAMVAGGGFIRLPAGAAIVSPTASTNGVAARLIPETAVEKTGTGALLVANLRGALSVTEGSVIAGGSYLADCSITVSDGASLMTAVPAVYAVGNNLLADGSFELGTRSGYWNANDTYWKIASTNRMSNGTYYIYRGSNAAWDNETPVEPDGTHLNWLQMDGSICQTIEVPAAGVYDFSIWNFIRKNYFQSMAAMYILIDGVPYGTIVSAWQSSGWKNSSTGPIWLSAGTHTVTLMGERGWEDSTIFTDKAMLAPPVLASVSSFSASSATQPSETTDSRVTYVQQGTELLNHVVSEGTVTEARQLFAASGPSKWSGVVLNVGGVLTLGQALGRAGTTHWFYKRGHGLLDLGSAPLDAETVLQEGTLACTSFPHDIRIYSQLDAPARLRMLLPEGETRYSHQIYLQGCGNVELDLPEKGRLLTMETVRLTAERIAFNPESSDSVISVGMISRHGTHSTGWTTDIVKKGAGTLLFRTRQDRDYPWHGALVLREGALRFGASDVLLADNTFVFGDTLTPADAALTLDASVSPFVCASPVTVTSAGSSASITAAWDLVFSAPITLARDTFTVNASGTVVLSGVSSTAGLTPVLNVSSAAAVIFDGDVGADVTVALKSGAAVSAGRDREAVVALPSLTLDGSSEFSFRSGINDRFDVGDLTFGAAHTISLFDPLTGGAYNIPGVYTLFTYASKSGSAAALTVDPASRTAGYTYTFNDTGSAVTLTIAAEADNPVHTWTASTGGAWQSDVDGIPLRRRTARV